VRVEAEAILSILEMAEAGKLELIGSDIIDDELAQMPNDERRNKVKLLLGVAAKHVSISAMIEQRAKELLNWNISPLDALHLASAEASGADYFLTTDDYLLRRAGRHANELNVKVENPAKWFIEKTTDES